MYAAAPTSHLGASGVFTLAGALSCAGCDRPERALLCDRLSRLGLNRCSGAGCVLPVFHTAAAVVEPAAIGQGLTARNRKAAISTRCVAPCSRVARPGTIVSTPTMTVREGEREQNGQAQHDGTHG